jgi:hypothetical protein
MREPMSDNWELVKEGLFHLYKAKDNSYICTAYVERPSHPMMVVRTAFIRDLNMITGPLSKYKWCPRFGDENRDGWRIYLVFQGHFCQDILDRNESIEQYCPNWQEQLTQMCLDLRKEQVYKIAMNPEYFFIDEDKNLKTFGFFNSFHQLEQPVMMELVMPTLTSEQAQFVYPRIQHGRFDFKSLEEFAYLKSTWPGEILKDIYGKMYAVNSEDNQA